jgi:hypothetical protein
LVVLDGDEQRIAVGQVDPSGSLSVNLDERLPTDFPKHTQPKVFVFDTMGTGQANGNFNARKRLCDSVLGVCMVTQLDVSDIVTARNSDRAEASIGANKARWVTIKGTCGENAPTIEACDSLRAWLAQKAPTMVQTPEIKGYVADAQQTLAQAEPTLARLREARDWSALDLRPCAQATGPTSGDIRQACGWADSFLRSFPSSVHAAEIHAVLGPADLRAGVLQAKEEAAAKVQAAQTEAAAKARAAEEERKAKAQVAEALRQQEAARAAEKARQHPLCISACRMRCADSVRFDECFAGCSGLCP